MDEANQETRVSSEPDCSSKDTQQDKKKTTPKKGGTQSEKEK